MNSLLLSASTGLVCSLYSIARSVLAVLLLWAVGLAALPSLELNNTTVRMCVSVYMCVSVCVSVCEWVCMHVHKFVVYSNFWLAYSDYWVVLTTYTHPQSCTILITGSSHTVLIKGFSSLQYNLTCSMTYSAFTDGLTVSQCDWPNRVGLSFYLGLLFVLSYMLSRATTNYQYLL